MADTGTSEPPQLHEPTYLHCLFLSITYIYLSAYPTGSVSQENPNIIASLKDLHGPVPIMSTSLPIHDPDVNSKHFLAIFKMVFIP